MKNEAIIIQLLKKIILIFNNFITLIKNKYMHNLFFFFFCESN